LKLFPFACFECAVLMAQLTSSLPKARGVVILLVTAGFNCSSCIYSSLCWQAVSRSTSPTDTRSSATDILLSPGVECARLRCLHFQSNVSICESAQCSCCSTLQSRMISANSFFLRSFGCLGCCLVSEGTIFLSLHSFPTNSRNCGCRYHSSCKLGLVFPLLMVSALIAVFSLFCSFFLLGRCGLSGEPSGLHLVPIGANVCARRRRR
jgi:hypothetical protein